MFSAKVTKDGFSSSNVSAINSASKDIKGKLQLRLIVQFCFFFMYFLPSFLSFFFYLSGDANNLHIIIHI